MRHDTIRSTGATQDITLRSSIAAFAFQSFTGWGLIFLTVVTGGGAALLSVPITVLVWLRYAKARYRLEGDALIARRGILRSTEREVALDSIAEVTFTATDLQKQFGNGDVRIMQRNASGRLRNALTIPNVKRVTMLRDALCFQIGAHGKALSKDQSVGDEKSAVQLMSEQTIVGMVEDYWRAFLLASANGQQSTATKIVNQFQRRVDDMAALLPPDQQRAYIAAVTAVREDLFENHSADPEALKQRLGIVSFVPRTSSRMGLGELAVRTAVRATVWESVFSVFRLFR